MLHRYTHQQQIVRELTPLTQHHCLLPHLSNENTEGVRQSNFSVCQGARQYLPPPYSPPPPPAIWFCPTTHPPTQHSPSPSSIHPHSSHSLYLQASSLHLLTVALRTLLSKPELWDSHRLKNSNTAAINRLGRRNSRNMSGLNTELSLTDEHYQ